MVNHLSWPDIHMNQYVLPSAQLACTDDAFMHIPEALQLTWLTHMFLPITLQNNAARLHMNGMTYTVEQPHFWQHIKLIMCRGGLLANLSLYDNLLLPSLYHNYSISSERVTQVIKIMALEHDIHQQAAERNDELHARISLGQCLLFPPKMIIIQDICTSLSMANKAFFYDLLASTL